MALVIIQMKDGTQTNIFVIPEKNSFFTILFLNMIKF